MKGPNRTTHELYLKMIEDFVAECWTRLHTVEEVHAAIDKFMADLGYQAVTP